MTKAITSTTGNGLISRFFGKQQKADKPTPPKPNYCIPIEVLDHALFGEGGPLADLEQSEKRFISKSVVDRLEDLGWAVPYSRQALNLREHEYHRKLREMEHTGGVFLRHIKKLIDRTYDFQQARQRLGRGVPQPFPIGAYKWATKGNHGGGHDE